MNPVITAPDSFEVIDLAAGSNMNNVQRRNLGSIAKILQHAASFKIFDSDARYNWYNNIQLNFCTYLVPNLIFGQFSIRLCGFLTLT